LQPLLNLFCILSGTNLAFDQATLDELYPSKGSYVGPFSAATNALKAQGFLLGQDTKRLIHEAVKNGP